MCHAFCRLGSFATPPVVPEPANPALPLAGLASARGQVLQGARSCKSRLEREGYLLAMPGFRRAASLSRPPLAANADASMPRSFFAVRSAPAESKASTASSLP